MSVRPAGRSALSREEIVSAAIELIDQEGLVALSMRRLGAELGVEAMSLYRHVEGREDLLEAVVESLTSRLELSSDMDLGPQGGWQAYLQQLAHTVRELAATHPRVFPLIATRNPAAPWIRPPIRSLDVIEDFLTVLISSGFTDDQAIAAYRAFTSFLVGQLLLTAAQAGGSAVVVEGIDDGGDPVPTKAVDLAEYPHIDRLQGKLTEDHSREEFEIALEDLLDRIQGLKRR